MGEKLRVNHLSESSKIICVKVRKLEPSREVWFPDLMSCPLGGPFNLNNPSTYFSDVIKIMDVFSILQEATSDDNLCRMYIGWAPFL